MSVQAVFFDFGGTLFSYREVQGRSFVPIMLEGLERLRVQTELPDAGRAYRRASAEAFQVYFPQPYYLHRDVFMETFRRFALHVGGDPTDEYLSWFHEAQRRMVYEGFALRPGCFEVLAELRASGAHVGLVSNIDDDYLGPMLERAGLHAHLDSWTSSEEARSCKPDAGIYRHAIAKAGGIDPGRCVFVGDSPEQDIAGARRLGMHTILISDAGVEPPASGAGSAGEPHDRIKDLREIPALVRRLTAVE
jgi:HAD superfamily hydrolase (TIGR01509 family)